MRIRLPLLFLALTCTLAAPLYGASKINLKKGDPLQGDIQKVTPTEVTYKRGIAEPETVAVNLIAGIEWEGEPAETRLGRTAEANGQLDRALENYQKALGSAGSNENVKAELQFLVARTEARLGKNDAAVLDEAIKKLDAYSKENQSFYRYYDSLKWLGRSHMQKKQFAEAGAAFDKLAASKFPDDKMEAQVAQAKLKFRQDQVDAALAVFKQVAEMKADTPLQKAQQMEARLGQAQCLYVKNDFDQALKLLDKVNTEADSTDAQLQGTAYLAKGDCYLGKNQPKEALMAFLHVDVLFDQNTDAHAKALFHLSKLWSQNGKPAKGADAARRLGEMYPQSEWLQKLKSGS